MKNIESLSLMFFEYCMEKNNSQALIDSLSGKDQLRFLDLKFGEIERECLAEFKYKFEKLENLQQLNF